MYSIRNLGNNLIYDLRSREREIVACNACYKEENFFQKTACVAQIPYKRRFPGPKEL